MKRQITLFLAAILLLNACATGQKYASSQSKYRDGIYYSEGHTTDILAENKNSQNSRLENSTARAYGLEASDYSGYDRDRFTPARVNVYNNYYGRFGRYAGRYSGRYYGYYDRPYSYYGGYRPLSAYDWSIAYSSGYYPAGAYYPIGIDPYYDPYWSNSPYCDPYYDPYCDPYFDSWYGPYCYNYYNPYYCYNPYYGYNPYFRSYYDPYYSPYYYNVEPSYKFSSARHDAGYNRVWTSRNSISHSSYRNALGSYTSSYRPRYRTVRTYTRSSGSYSYPRSNSSYYRSSGNSSYSSGSSYSNSGSYSSGSGSSYSSGSYSRGGSAVGSRGRARR